MSPRCPKLKDTQADVKSLLSSVFAHGATSVLLQEEVATALASVSALVEKTLRVRADRKDLSDFFLPATVRSQCVWSLRVAVLEALTGAALLARDTLRTYEQALAIHQATPAPNLEQVLELGRDSFEAIVRAAEGLVLAQKSIISLVGTEPEEAAADAPHIDVAASAAAMAETKALFDRLQSPTFRP